MTTVAANRLDVLLVSWDGGGNVPPMLALGKRLSARGHRATFLATENLGSRVAEAGLDFRPFRQAQSWMPRSGESIEDDLLSFALHLAGPEIGADLFDAVDEARPDVVVVDAMAAGALSAAEKLGLPACVLVHLRYRFFTEERGAAGWAGFFDTVNEHRKALDLPPLSEPVGFLAELWPRVGPVLVTGHHALEGPGRPLPAHVRHVGPVFDPAPGTLASALADTVVPDGRPLVVVSLSTTYMHQEALLGSILDATAQLDVRVAVTLGHGIGPEVLSDHEGAVVVPWVPHEVLLRHADAVVTHAGYGTVLAALRAGVPLVCVPMARDQPGNADRVSALGAGVTVGADAPASSIRAALEQVLLDEACRTAARRLGTELARHGDGECAANAVEALASPVPL